MATRPSDVAQQEMDISREIEGDENAIIAHVNPSGCHEVPCPYCEEDRARMERRRSYEQAQRFTDLANRMRNGDMRVERAEPAPRTMRVMGVDLAEGDIVSIENVDGIANATYALRTDPAWYCHRHGKVEGSGVFVLSLDTTSMYFCTHCLMDLFAERGLPPLIPHTGQPEPGSIPPLRPLPAPITEVPKRKIRMKKEKP